MTPNQIRIRASLVAALAFALGVGAGAPNSGAAVLPLVEAEVGIDIYATPGEIAFRGGFAGPAVQSMTVSDPSGAPIYDVSDQAIDDNFFTNNRMDCATTSVEDYVATHAPEGPYAFDGSSADGMDSVEGQGEIVGEFPAAPDIASVDGETFFIDESGTDAVVEWLPGTGHGARPAPVPPEFEDLADVFAEAWIVIVQPDTGTGGFGATSVGEVPRGTYQIEVAAGVNRVEIPFAYLWAYSLAGVTEFKIQVAARRGTNRTFSDGAISVVRTGGGGPEPPGPGGGIFGQMVTVGWFFPTKVTLGPERPEVVTVTDEVEIPGIAFGAADMDISANNVEIVFNTAFWFSGSALYNGFTLSDEPFVTATLDGSTTVQGVEVAVVNGTLCIDLKGIMMQPGDVVSVNFTVN